MCVVVFSFYSRKEGDVLLLTPRISIAEAYLALYLDSDERHQDRVNTIKVIKVTDVVSLAISLSRELLVW